MDALIFADNEAAARAAFYADYGVFAERVERCPQHDKPAYLCHYPEFVPGDAAAAHRRQKDLALELEGRK